MRPHHRLYVESRIMETNQVTNLIDGRWIKALSGKTAQRHDPATGERIGDFADSNADDAALAVAAARTAFERNDWSRDPRRRQMVLQRWADRLEADSESLAHLLSRENGKVLAQARGEMAGAISEIRYYAGLARFTPGHAFEVAPGEFSTLLKEPAGVATLIIPWNAPVVLLIRALAPALTAGCTTIVKPAWQTAFITAALLKPLHDDDALPKGVLNMVVERGSAASIYLTTADDVDVVSFTGSTATGQRIMQAAAPTMKKLSLELGGKSSCLVFEDADIDAAAPALARAATIISGQQCTAARRVLVHASVYPRMKQALTAALGALRVGPGLSAGTDIGPMIDAQALQLVAQQVAHAEDVADEVLLASERPGGALAQGHFMTPSLVAHRDTSAFFVQEEIFGPMVVLERFEDEAEAVVRANHSHFGLSASVWTRDGARAMRVARALRDGTVWINDHNKLFAEAETGGYRRSGLGRLHGYEALNDFLEIKHIYQNVGI